jgi:hypothetical protein
MSIIFCHSGLDPESSAMDSGSEAGMTLPKEYLR